MFYVMPTSPFPFATILWTPSCWFSAPVSVLWFCTSLQPLDFHRAKCCMLCCLSHPPENKLHQSWPSTLLNPANSFQWGFAAPLEPSLLMMSVSRTCPSPRHDYPGLCPTSNSAEIFPASQPSFSHFGLKVASPALMGLGNSAKRKSSLSVVLPWLHEFSWLQWFS